MPLDMLFLDKHGDSNQTWDWRYFRITPIAGTHIETCEVTFPDFKDKETPIQTPFVVGLSAVPEITQDLLGAAGIDRSRSVLIGLRERH